MSFSRINFQSADAARFNQLRDQWRSAAASCDLSRAGLRVAGVLPTFINREMGFAFPTDEDLAAAIGANEKTAKRGLGSLGEFHLIDRVTNAKRDKRGVVIGRVRRIYLTLPAPKGQLDLEPKGHSPKGQAQPKGQNSAAEGTDGCPNILDRYTLDKDSAYEKEDKLEGTYTGTDPSVAAGAKEKKEQPSSQPSLAPAERASSPAQEQNTYAAAKNGDHGFAPSVQPAPSAENVPSVTAPSPRWQQAKHPKILQGRPLSRVPFPAPKSTEAAQAFLLKHHVPALEWLRLLPDLMDGHLYEYDIEPWMDAA